ncbi:MAG: DUF5317 family protein [Actinomycetota bacterium]|nr:DUF5317 family protein [Actinomycetota bacterium]
MTAGGHQATAAPAGTHPRSTAGVAGSVERVLFSLVALLLGGVIGAVLGGDVRHLTTWRLRSWWLLIPGVAAQIAADRWHLAGLDAAIGAGSYLCLLAFVWRNVLLVGMGVVAVGLVANLAVITVDGGMPVHPAAVVAAGIAAPNQLADIGYGHRHHLESGGDHVTFLDDRLPLGALHQVLSIGDLILFVGVADVAANLVRRQRRRRVKVMDPWPTRA